MASSPNRRRYDKERNKWYEYTLSPEALENEKKAHEKWASENHYRLYVYAPLELKERLSQLRQRRGMSLSALVVDILEKELEKEGL